MTKGESNLNVNAENNIDSFDNISVRNEAADPY